MHLTLRGPGPDGPPGDEVREELGRDRVEEFAPRGQPEVGEIREKLARDPEASVDSKAPVDVGVADQALPTDAGSRLLEVDAHHHQQVVAKP